jgi:hypothetical protein
MFRRCAIVLVVLSFLLPVAAAQAEVVLPTGLVPNSQYEIAFVTADSTTATSSDITNYNNFVTMEARQDRVLAGLGVTWNAIASTGSVNANANAPFVSSIPVYNTLGQLVANATYPLYDQGVVPGSRENPLYTQTGGTQSSPYAWTGSNSAGNQDVTTEIFGGHATTTYHGLGSAEPSMGAPADYTYSGFLSYYVDPATTYLPLYALSTPITVPEPGSLALLLAGVVSLLAYARRRRKRAS